MTDTPQPTARDEIVKRLRFLNRNLRQNWPYQSYGEFSAAADLLEADAKEIERLRDALIIISEYWNKSETEGAMSNALYTIVSVAECALEDGAALYNQPVEK